MTTSLLFATLALATPDFQAVLDDVRERQDVPGVSIGVIVGGEIVYTGGSGVSDLATREPMRADTVLYMGSVSKVLTAILALRMVEDGRIDLDYGLEALEHGEPDERWRVTLEHLLTHSSGLNREGNFGYWFSGEFPSEQQLIDYVGHTQLRFEPGTDLHYSNIGYAAIGYMTSGRVNVAFDELLRSRVLEPLDMTSTGITPLPEGIANGYSPPGRKLPNENRPFAGIGDKVGDRWERMYHDAAAMSPAFGIHTTANDLAVLARFLLGHGHDDILSQEMRERMRSRQESGWGLGLKVQRYRGNVVNRHDGWFAAHKAHLMIDAENDIGVVVLANGDNAEPGNVADTIYDAIVAKGLISDTHE